MKWFVVLMMSIGSVLLHAKETDAQEIPLQVEPLWDVERPKQWQIIARGPSDLCWGQPGEIFVADTGNSRVLLVDDSGDLVQIIGRRGSGPGEFLRPSDLDYDEELEMLWVADPGAARYTRFKLLNGEYRYYDSFISARFSAANLTNLAIEDASHFWTTIMSLTYGRDEHKNGTRIQLFDTSNTLQRQLAPSRDSESVLPKPYWNLGFLLPTGHQHLAFVWLYRPVIEVWNKNGKLIAERVLEGPITDRPPPEREGENVWGAYSFFTAVAYDDAEDVIFVEYSTPGKPGPMFVAHDATNLAERERYIIDADGGDAPIILHFLVDRTNEGIRFIAIDSRTLGLVLLRPKG